LYVQYEASLRATRFGPNSEQEYDMKIAFSLLFAILALTPIVVPATSFATERTLSATEPMLARGAPRVPGGSGCDDPDDINEHPECR
jgi:hypothetical protein